MAPDQLTTKVRLVRCPKCRNLLPELPNFQVYKCGGCGVILQAKNRANGMRMSSSLNETVATQKIGLNHVSEEKKSSSSSPNATPPESGECFPGGNNERHQSFSVEGKECSRSNDKPTFPDSGKYFSDQNNEKNEDKSSEDRKSSSTASNGTFPDLGESFSGQNSEKNQDKAFENEESNSSSPHSASFPDSGEFLSEQNKGKSEDKSSEDKESGSSSSSSSTCISDTGECSSGQNNEIQSKSSEDNDFRSSSPKATSPDSGEFLSEQSNGKSEEKSPKEKVSGSSSLSASISDSRECCSGQTNEIQSKSSEGNDFSSSSPKATLPVPGECFPDQRNERDQIRSSEGHESSSSSPRATFPDSGDCFPDPKKEESQNKSSEDKEFGTKATFPDSGEFTSNQTNGMDPDMSSAHGQGEQCGDLNSSCEEEKNRSVISHSQDFDGQQLEVPNDICTSTVLADNETEPSLQITRTHSGVPILDEGSPLNKAVDSDFNSSSAVNPRATINSSAIVTAYVPARESTSSDALASPPDEQLKGPQNSVPNGSNHGRLPDTLEIEFNPSSEFSDALREMSKSPARRSHHAYDGSVSSYDGRDDQFSNRNMRSNFVHSQGRPRKDKFLVNSIMGSDSRFQHKAMDSWSSFSEKNDNVMRYRKWDQDELLQPSRQGHPTRDWNRLQRDEYQSRTALRRRAPQSGYPNGGPRSQLHHEYESETGYQSSVKSVDAKNEKMALLRMVYELQDQVNNLNEKANGRVAGGVTWEAKRTPQYRNYEPSEEELFHDPNYQRYLRNRRAGSHYPPQDRRFMRIPFSSEATTSRHQAEPSYLHSGPQDWQCSAPLPSRCSNNGLCRVHPGQNCWTSYDKSSPSSSERYVESDYSVWGRETMSHDLRHRRHDANKYAREQHYLAKRHFRPLAGGAPIISCYNCLKLLQIPADFLLFKRKYHRLRCGGCSEVLKFSLQKRCHIVPYEDCAIDPPPSEVGDYGAANFASTSQQEDPVSCSDDYGYGLAYRKGYSTEGDPGFLAPSNSLRESSDDINMIERKEFLMKQYQSKDKKPVDTYVSARPSLSSEIDELPQKSSSPLHRLMGYASPSQVIRGAGSSYTGTSSYARN